MRRKLTLILILLPALVFGQSKVHLEFESGGPRIGWIASEPSAPPDAAAKWDGKSYDLESSSTGNVYVLDTASGNLAEKKLSDTTKGWLVKDADFKEIGELKVRVEHEGKAVQVADVILNDGTTPRNALIDSTSDGSAEFYDVKPGNIGVEVSYHSGSASKTQKQSFSVDLKRDIAGPILVVSITGDVATAAAASAATTSGAANPSAPAKAPLSSTPTPISPQQKKVQDYAFYVLAVLFFAAVLYGGYVWLQKNPTKAQDSLQKVGLSLHDPSPFDPNLSAPVNTAAAPPPPQQQILLSDATPTPLPSAPAQPMVAATTHVASEPHFTRDSGEVIHIPDGAATLGRDAAVELSFPSESSLSRRHAEVVRSGVNILVRDLGSTNGTFVNGVKIDGDAALRPGDSVQFGTLRFRFEG